MLFFASSRLFSPPSGAFSFLGNLSTFGVGFTAGSAVFQPLTKVEHSQGPVFKWEPEHFSFPRSFPVDDFFFLPVTI